MLKADLGVMAGLVHPDLLALLDLSQILHLSSVKCQVRVERRVPPQIPSLTCRLRLDLLALEDHQECVVLLDHKVSWDLRETMEIQDQQGRQGVWVPGVSLGYLAKKERLAVMENLVHLDHLDLLESVVCLACLVYLDLKDIVDSLDWTEQREEGEVLAKREKMGPQVQ